MPVIGRTEQQKHQVSIRLTGAPELARKAADIVINAMEQSGRTITRYKGPVTTEADPDAVHIYISAKNEEE